MIVSECNNCRRRDPATPPPGWLLLLTAEPEPASPLSALFGSGPEIKGMFCSWTCVAEFAAVKALIDSASKETGENTP